MGTANREIGLENVVGGEGNNLSKKKRERQGDVFFRRMTKKIKT